MPMLLRLPSALLCLAAILPCQREEGTEDVKMDERRAKAAGEQQRGEKGEADGEDASLTPEQRLARHVTSGAQQYCRFLATVKPEKLLPGQTGTMTILATLVGQAVLPAPAMVEVLSTAQQGEVTIGALNARPAALGRHASGYVGRPVYDNYAVLDVPVTMAPSAQIGSKHVVSVEMKFDLYDGASAQPIGRFLDRVAATVEVGHVVDPVVQRRARGPDAEPEPEAPAPAATEAPADGSEPAPSTAPPEARTVVPAAVDRQPVAPAAEAPETPPGLEPDAGLPMPLLVGGAVLLLGVILLLARRR